MEGSYLNALLEIWDIDAKSCPNLLQDPELAMIKRNETSNTSFHTSQQSTAPCLQSNDSYLVNGEIFQLQEDPSTQVQIQQPECHNCHSSNELESNWCMNCGTAIVEKNKIADYTLKQNIDRVPDLMQPHTQLETQSLCSDSSDALKSSHFSIDTASNRSPPVHSTIPTLPNVHSRHWNTSSTYMWRKPSSINRRNCKSNFISKPKNVINSIPHLDLSAVCLDDTGLSTRDKISAKTVLQSSSSDCYSSLELLPNEILLIIVSFLNKKDLISCTYVCSRLYLIAKESNLWKNITIQKRSLKQKDLTSLVQQCTFLESLTIEKCSLKVGSSKLDFDTFFQELSVLKALKCTMTDLGPGTGDKLLLAAAMHCPLLNSIEFDWIALSEEAISRSIHIVKRFENVSIRQPGALSFEILNLLFSLHRQWLKSLNIKVYKSLDFSTVLAATEYLPVPNIKALASISIYQAELVENIQVIFPSLDSLSIEQDSLSTETTAQLLKVSLCSLFLQVYTVDDVMTSCRHLSLMSSLRELSLNCVDDQGVAVLSTGQLSLEVLDLSNSAVTLQCLSSISTSSFKQVLKLLKLNNCQGIKDSGITTVSTITSSLISLINNCPRLRLIEILELQYPQLQVNNFLKKMNSYTCKIVLS